MSRKLPKILTCEDQEAFLEQFNTRYPTPHLRRMVKKRAHKAGVTEPEKVSPHTFRHTFATDLYRETKNIRLVQKALGHSDLSTTMIYTHVVDEELEEAMNNFRGGKTA